MSQYFSKALSYLHEVNFVHCDLKPQNLLFCNSDCVSVGSSQAGKCWMLATCSQSTTNMSIYQQIRGGRTFIVHSPWRDGEGEVKKVSPEEVLGCFGRMESSNALYFPCHRLHWGYDRPHEVWKSREVMLHIQKSKMVLVLKCSNQLLRFVGQLKDKIGHGCQTLRKSWIVTTSGKS